MLRSLNVDKGAHERERGLKYRDHSDAQVLISWRFAHAISFQPSSLSGIYISYVKSLSWNHTRKINSPNSKSYYTRFILPRIFIIKDGFSFLFVFFFVDLILACHSLSVQQCEVLPDSPSSSFLCTRVRKKPRGNSVRFTYLSYDSTLVTCRKFMFRQWTSTSPAFFIVE